MNDRIPIKDDYFSWLCDYISINQPDRSFYLLAKQLYKKEFYSVIPRDENRAKDGLNLRNEFLSENGFVRDFTMESPCSVFEMLIGLSDRMSFLISNDCGGKSNKEWFLELLSNLKMDIYDDQHFFDYGDPLIDISVKLDTLLERSYDRKGNGGLFPLKRSRKDQRKIEIWYQMSTYLIENYNV